MTERTPDTGDRAEVSGGSFSGITVIGQHNSTTVVPLGTRRAEQLTTLRAEVRSLLDGLRAPGAVKPADLAGVVEAKVHAGELDEELAEEQPDGRAVRKRWTKLEPVIRGLGMAGAVASIGRLVTEVFTG
ncbi:hypothetical protein FHR81_002930 [Actinoalloteichus hoggarensis]|uniref:Uncharacterized protein n=1 Tax=Actinoalloteichus hoggarensis TaxID=1470176 RepID=A0A221VY91_9PSEU|nr:hypothetical protein [Actinoalloteichus hoggarensis]ASO18522.1 hypothetical protein AHOG_04330 [Actinoalloteichus hoggarensis]MBB5921890.1 hypothetical protein [Actinoalloteichus hoggarensis]